MQGRQPYPERGGHCLLTGGLGERTSHRLENLVGYSAGGAGPVNGVLEQAPHRPHPGIRPQQRRLPSGPGRSGAVCGGARGPSRGGGGIAGGSGAVPRLRSGGAADGWPGELGGQGRGRDDRDSGRRVRATAESGASAGTRRGRQTAGQTRVPYTRPTGARRRAAGTRAADGRRHRHVVSDGSTARAPLVSGIK